MFSFNYFYVFIQLILFICLLNFIHLYFPPFIYWSINFLEGLFWFTYNLYRWIYILQTETKHADRVRGKINVCGLYLFLGIELIVIILLIIVILSRWGIMIIYYCNIIWFEIMGVGKRRWRRMGDIEGVEKIAEE